MQDIIKIQDLLIGIQKREIEDLKKENTELMDDIGTLQITDDMIHDHYDSITDRIDELDSNINGLIKYLNNEKNEKLDHLETRLNDQTKIQTILIDRLLNIENIIREGK